MKSWKNSFTILKGIISVRNFFLRLFNSLLKNGFYILWSLIIPLITIGLGQGYEMLEYLIIQQAWLQIAFVFAGLTLMGFALWIIPTPALKPYVKILGLGVPNRMALFNFLTTERNEDNNEAFPLRLFAIMPLVVFIEALALSFVFSEDQYLYPITLSLGIVVLFLLFIIFRKKVFSLQMSIINFTMEIVIQSLPERRRKLTRLERRPYVFHILNLSFYILWIGLFAIFASFVMSPLLDTNHEFIARILLILFFFFYAVWQYGILYYIDNRLYLLDDSKAIQHKIVQDKKAQALSCNEDDDIAFGITQNTYRTLFLTVLGLIILLVTLSLRDKIGSASPLVILIVFFTFYLMFFDVIYKTPIRLIKHYEGGSKLNTRNPNHYKRLRLKRFVLIFIATVFSYILLFEDFNEHRMRKHALTETEHYYSQDDREDLATYFEKWYEERGRPENVFLIAGQGGGSRAAAWMHLCLDRIDSSQNFMNQVFAFSTASGSSVGVSMKMAEWRLRQFDSTNTTLRKKGSCIKQLYTSNLFSNSFYGLLFGDMFDAFIPNFLYKKQIDFDMDKNFRLQREEYLGFMKAFNVKKENKFLRRVMQQHFEGDYLSFYYPEPNNAILNYYKRPPLFMINTTHVQSGNRAVISPIRIKDFSGTVDVCGELKKFDGISNDGKTRYSFPLEAAVCQSQAFPVISSFNYVDSLGNFADGGIVENSGCGTLWEMYRNLRQLPQAKGVKFNIIVVPNSGGVDTTGMTEKQKRAIRENDFKNTTSAIMGAVSAFYNGCLTAYPEYWKTELENEVKKHPGDSFYTLQLKENITLARILNDNSLRAMYQNLEDIKPEIDEIKTKIKKP